ncbi:heme ABC transporter ATP-binding protein [Amorphus sp. 3PC139-8]|uniref:heme ABC transporter ATP-binding protein n=1 Tax=Amorphus sp. 3PC139-8 TaxID=2735676 RepID=UPI00345D62B3
MLIAEGLGLRRGGRWLIRDVAFSAEPGKTIAVIGPNGAGKSTLLKVLTGELNPDTGQVQLDGSDVARLSRAILARRRAVLPQATTLTFPFSVREVAELGITVPAFPLSGPARAALVGRALQTVELSALADASFDTLSGGEKQRAQLARVLCQLWAAEGEGAMPLLFLDEPTASQDLAHQLAVLDVARDHAKRGGAVVAVLHDLNLAVAWADRIVAISGGRIYADGPAETVVTETMLADVFQVRLSPGALPADRTPFVLPQTAVRLVSDGPSSLAS